MRNVLIVVDMQNDFIDGSLGSDQAQKIVDNVCEEINKEEYDCIVATLDTHQSNYLETLEGKNLPIVHCVKGTTGWGLNHKVEKSLETIGCKKYFEKPTFGSFDLVEWLKNNADQLEEITLVGLCTDICVMSNALLIRAAFPNLKISIVENACWATSEEKQEASLKVLESNQVYRKG